MPYFKDPKGTFHSLSDADVADGHVGLLPIGSVSATEAEVAILTAEPPKPIPSVTPRQIRLALTQLGLRAAVETAVTAASQDVLDTWHYATEFDRNNPLVASLATQLNVTSEQLDGLWRLAATL